MVDVLELEGWAQGRALLAAGAWNDARDMDTCSFGELLQRPTILAQPLLLATLKWNTGTGAADRGAHSGMLPPDRGTDNVPCHMLSSSSSIVECHPLSAQLGGDHHFEIKLNLDKTLCWSSTRCRIWLGPVTFALL